MKNFKDMKDPIRRRNCLAHPVQLFCALCVSTEYSILADGQLGGVSTMSRQKSVVQGRPVIGVKEWEGGVWEGECGRVKLGQ